MSPSSAVVARPHSAWSLAATSVAAHLYVHNVAHLPGAEDPQPRDGTHRGSAWEIPSESESFPDRGRDS
jgi:hypothetical protein